MKIKERVIIYIIMILIPLVLIFSNISAKGENLNDLDPLIDIEITFEILKIRSLERLDLKSSEIEWIDFLSKPDFYVKLFINDNEFKSPVYRNQRYVYDPDWSVTFDVPDNIEFVNITIQLWDWEIGIDKLCDISGDYYDGLFGQYDVELRYSIKTGHWGMGDFTSNDPVYKDPSGYGRLCGTDDGSIYQRDRDCELWFNIYQNDFDNDGIPYWTEINKYNTNPEIDDRGRDDDGDGIPIEWEFKWGYYLRWNWWNHTYSHMWFYDPFIWDDHENMDVDGDSINNYEEYLTSQWGSDPFRKDVFVELDQMAEGPNGEPASILSEKSKELLFTAFNRQNIVLHLDDGRWEDTESDIIPFDDFTPRDELQQKYYWEYFLEKDRDNWRQGVFHYGMMVYDADYAGYCFSSNAFQVSTHCVEHRDLVRSLSLFSRAINMDVAYASVYMHELGHTFGFWPIPGHDMDSYYPWQIGWWKSHPYVSCMNYAYCYRMVDYSNGTHGKKDYDDWERMDFTYFERSIW